jgi:hypothetical protein
MDQILRANAINFAVLAALPAFGLSLLLLMLLRTWIQRVCIYLYKLLKTFCHLQFHYWDICSSCRPTGFWDFFSLNC